jgi:hypothetical protein
MKVLPPSPELAAGFKTISEQLTADWLKKAGADDEAVIAAYRKLRHRPALSAAIQAC